MMCLLVALPPHLKLSRAIQPSLPPPSDALSKSHEFHHWHKLRAITSVYFPAQIKLMILLQFNGPAFMLPFPAVSFSFFLSLKLV